MLARTPKTTEIDFANILTIPPKPAAIAEADAAWRNAVSDREAGQARHIEATRQLQAQIPGQPPTITMREVEELGLALVPLLNAEKIATEDRARLRARYEEDTNATLSAALEKYAIAIADKISELETLLGYGSALHAASVAAGVKLPTRLPGDCGAIIKAGVEQARYYLRGASRPVPIVGWPQSKPQDGRI
ncbi:hypothetical protein NKI12_08105 [Mesorhizobium australicum]|uniref:Uncharacterized protein n=1 Tax=Mesorhizobium australicum TaxID=536018 RepID=A0ACC6STX6_9HYPH